jgi:hypothetical protein
MAAWEAYTSSNSFQRHRLRFTRSDDRGAACRRQVSSPAGCLEGCTGWGRIGINDEAAGCDYVRWQHSSRTPSERIEYVIVEIQPVEGDIREATAASKQKG